MEKYKIMWQDIRRILHDFINMPNFKKTLFWGVALYLIALFALLRGDIYYLDDWGSASRETSWSHFSRYLATFILNDLSTLGKDSLDISPLLQILGILFVVVSSMILIYLIRKKLDLLGIIASLPLGLSPYFLENLSYKFESITMSIALFLAILPFLFQAQRRIFSAVSVVCLILMFSCYQAANAAYIILSLFFAFFMQADLRGKAGFLARCACNLIIASLIYKLAIAEPVSAHTITYTSDKMIALNGAFLLGVWVNLSAYLTTIFSDFKQTPYIWLIALNFALFALNVAFYSNRRIYAICGAIVFLALGIALSYGLYLVLEKPILNPRVFYGFNVLVAVISIANISQFAESCPDSVKFAESSTKSTQNPPPHSLQKLHKIPRILSTATILIVAYFLISFANIYANALKKQDEYIAFRAGLLARDLQNLPKNAVIVIKGEIAYSTVSARFIDKYGDISRLLGAYRNVNWVIWALTHFNTPHNLRYESDEICEMLEAQFGSEVVAENAWHIIKKAKVCYFITMK